MARIDAVGQLLACAVATFAGILQADVGVGAQEEQFFLSLEALLQAPPLTPAWGNKDEQSTLIKELRRLRAGLGIADSGVSEGHFGVTLLGVSQLTRKLPLLESGCRWTMLLHNKRIPIVKNPHRGGFFDVDKPRWSIS